MSFGWSNEVSEKDYEIKGTVTISTEEYRDLINEACTLRAKGQKEHDDWYDEYNKRRELESKLSKCETKIQEFNDWLNSDDSARTKFKLWKVEKESADEEE